MFGNLIRYFASMLPMSFSMRVQLYKLSGMTIGKDVVIDRDFQVTKYKHVTIGDRVTISKSVSLLANLTAVNSKLEKDFHINRTKDIIIEDDVYIGVKATILPGVRLGKMCTIGANTVVMRNIPPYAIVLGVPGRIFGFRDPNSVSETEPQ